MEKRGIGLLVVVVALAIIYFSLQINAETLPTEIEVDYDNIPPVLIQNIPDQYLAINIPKINAFDLDDYFVDNETLSYSVNYTGDQNVTVTIGSGNLVSFYPDTNFNGSINVTFIANDGFTTAESNLVQIFVSDDTQPPQWSNPTITHPGSAIYQNSYVNFSVIWTDDFGLDNFVFMINQGTGWTEYTAEPMTGTQNVSRYRVQISSSGGTVYWKVGAYDLSDNYNETAVQNFTVETTPSPPAGGGSGESEEREPQYGVGYVPASIPSTVSRASNFTLSAESFKIELKQGSSNVISIKITNTGTEDLQLKIGTLGLEMFNITISLPEFNLSSGESEVVTILFEADEGLLPDIYYGKVTVSTASETREIPVTIILNPLQTDLELSLQIPEEYKEVRQGEIIKSNITLTNLADIRSREINFYYALTDFEGKVLDSKTETFVFSEKAIIMEKELTVPENAPRGEYLFSARATAADTVALDADTFFVGSKFTVMGFIRANLLILLIIIASIIVAMLMVKHYRNKERLRLLNLYIMITNLKKLMKEGDLEGAIRLYIRIKSSYGQPLSRSAMQNKEELKKEIEKLTEKLHSSGAIEQIKKEAEKIEEKETKQESPPQEKKEENVQIDKQKKQPEKKEKPKIKPKQEIKKEEKKDTPEIENKTETKEKTQEQKEEKPQESKNIEENVKGGQDATKK
jgi:hypothetical protein